MPQEIFIGRKYELEKIESAYRYKYCIWRSSAWKVCTASHGEKETLTITKMETAQFWWTLKISDYKTAARKISAALFDEGILKEEHITEDWSELARDLKKRLKDTDGFHSLFSAVAG